MYLDYVGIRVTDLERSLRLYSGPLGLAEVRRGTMGHGGVWVLLEDPSSHQRLELNWYPPGSKYDVPFFPGEGLDHVAFRVESVFEAIRRLVDHGGELAAPPWGNDADGWVAYIKDPDGNWLELISPVVPLAGTPVPAE